MMGPALNFDWDDDKASSNVAKHGIGFEYAVRVFLDADRVDFDVSRSEDGEERRKTVGMIEQRLFAVGVYRAAQLDPHRLRKALQWKGTKTIWHVSSLILRTHPFWMPTRQRGLMR